MKIPASVMKFAANNQEVYTAFRDYYNHYRAINGNTKVEYSADLSFDEKEAKINAALKREIVRLAGVQNFADYPVEMWISNPQISWATFATVGMMIDMILPESIVDTVGMYSEVIPVGWGDNASFKVSSRDIFAVTKVGKGQRDVEVHKQYKGQVTINPELRAIGVSVSLFRVLAGLESLAEFVMKAVRSLETQMTLDIYSAFATAMAALPNTATTGLRVAGYSQNALVSLCQRVTAWNQGSKAIIMGTQLALSNVLPNDANYRYQIDSDFVRVGYIKTAFGYDVLAVPQVADHTTPWGTVIADDKLWILSPASQKIVKVVLEGASMSYTNQPFENADLSQNSVIYKSYGTGIVTNATAGIITL